MVFDSVEECFVVVGVCCLFFVFCLNCCVVVEFVVWLCCF